MWVPGECAFFTMSKCALLLESRVLVHGMFCKRHLSLGYTLVLFQGEAGEWMSRGFKNQFFGTFETFTVAGQACLLSAMIVSEFVGLATVILRFPFLVLFEKAELSLGGIRQFYVGLELEERNLNTFCDLHESQRFGSPCIPRDCWSRFGCRGPPFSLRMVAQGILGSWSESNLAKNLESVNARQWMVEFEKFKLGSLDLWCFDSAIWLTWYPSCLLVTVWLGRSIALYSVFLFSWSESNLAKKLECDRTQVDARFRKVQAGVLELWSRERGMLSAPREEAFVFPFSVLCS